MILRLPSVADIGPISRCDGSLVVTIDTMIDGAGSSITATRTIVLGFDRAGKPRIVKSTIKYETETD